MKDVSIFIPCTVDLFLPHIGEAAVSMNQDEFCCGFGGEFAIHYPDISESMVQDKVQNYLDSGADLLILCEPGCLLNIGGYLSRHHPEKRAMHLASFLADGGGAR